MSEPERGHSGARAGLAANQPASPAVLRMVAILNMMAEQPDTALGPSEISRRTGVAKSTVINLCSSMADTRLLRKADSAYMLGPLLAPLGVAFLRSVREVEEFYEVCRSVLGRVPQTVQLAVLGQGAHVLYLARHDGTEPLQLGLASEIGRSVPAHCTAAGKALLAALPLDDFECRYSSGTVLEQPTRGSIGKRTRLKAEIADIRKRGIAMEDGEIVPGIRCLGIAVSTPHREDGLIAISFTFRAADFSDPDLDVHVAQLTTVAEHFAARIGGSVFIGQGDDPTGRRYG